MLSAQRTSISAGLGVLTAAGALMLGVSPATAASVSAKPTHAKTTQRAFNQQAGALCQGYFTSARAQDAEISQRLGTDPDPLTQISVTSELLYANASLSLATEQRLARLSAPAGSQSTWQSALASDRASALLTLSFANSLSQFTLLTLADSAVSAYDSAYQQAEAGWNTGVAALGISGCR